MDLIDLMNEEENNDDVSEGLDKREGVGAPQGPGEIGGVGTPAIDQGIREYTDYESPSPGMRDLIDLLDEEDQATPYEDEPTVAYRDTGRLPARPGQDRTETSPEASVSRIANAAWQGVLQLGQSGIGFGKGLMDLAESDKQLQARLQKESEHPMSYISRNMSERARFDKYLRDLGYKRETMEKLFRDPAYAKEFAARRHDYLVQQNTKRRKYYSDVEKKLRSHVALNPEYFQSSGWVEDFARMGPQIGMQLASGIVGGPAAAGLAMFAQIAGSIRDEQIRKGVDPERAMIAGLAAASVEAPMEAFSFSKLGRVLKIGKLGKAGAIAATETAKKLAAKQTAMQTVKQLAEVFGTEQVTEYLQGYPELAAAIWSENPDSNKIELFKKFSEKVTDPDFQWGQIKEGNIAGAWALFLGVGGKALGRLGHSPQEVGGHGSNTGKIEPASGDPKNAIPSDDGVTVVPREDTSNDVDIKTLVTEGTLPSVENLLGVSEAPVRAPVKTQDGVSAGNSLTVTPQQAEEQLLTNEAEKRIVTEAVTDENMQRARVQIDNSKQKIAAYEQFMVEAAQEEDHETALEMALRIEAETQNLATGYQTIVTQAAKNQQNKSAQLNPEIVDTLQTQLQERSAKARANVAAFKNAVNRQKLEENQKRIDLLNTDKGLEAELLDASVEAQNTGNSKAYGLYNKVLGEMRLKDTQGEGLYFKDTPMKKLVDLKNKISQQAFANRKNGADTNTQARDNALMNWVTSQIEAKANHDLITFQEQEKIRTTRGVQEPVAVKQPETIEKPYTIETREERQQARAERASRAAEVIAKVDERAAELNRIREARERAASLKKREQIKKQQETVHKQKTQLRAPEVQKKQAQRLATQKRKETEADARRVAERKAALKRQQQKWGWLDAPTAKALEDQQSTELGKLTNEDIANMTYGQRARLALGPDASAKDVKVLATRARKAAQRLRKQSKLSTKAMSSEAPRSLKQRAQELFRSAAVRFKGKVYEGPGHMGTIMQNPELEQAIFDADSKDFGTKFEDGFVTHDGTFVPRVEATKMVGKKDGGDLYTEDFLEMMEALTGANTTLVIDEDTADSPDTLMNIEQMAQGLRDKKYSWLFKLAKAMGVKTHVVFDYDALIGSKAFKSLPPHEQQQLTRERWNRVMGTTSPLTHHAFINAEKFFGRPMARVVETMVHENIHGILRSKLKRMPREIRAQFDMTLQKLWDSIPQEVKDKAAKTTNMQGLRYMEKAINQIDNNVQELVTYAMSNSEFANWLNSIEATNPITGKKEGKTIWQYLRELVAKVVDKTKMTELVDILDDFLDIPMITKAGKTIPKIKWSKEQAGTRPGTHSRQQVQQWAKELDDNAKNALETVVVDNAQQAEELLGYVPDDNVVSAWIPAPKKRGELTAGGRVLIIADRIRDKEHVLAKWLHEQVGHQGLRSIFGSNKAAFNDFLSKAFTLFKTSNRALIEETAGLYGIQPSTIIRGIPKYKDTDIRVIAEEIIANRTKDLKPPVKRGLVTRLRKLINKWLPKRYTDVIQPGKHNKVLTDKDIMTILEAAHEQIVTGNNEFGKYLESNLEKRRGRFSMDLGLQSLKDKLPKFMHSDKKYISMIKEIVKDNPDVRHWYTQHNELVNRVFGPDADLFKVLLAITSPRAEVSNNARYAVETYAYLLGLVDKPGKLYWRSFKEDIDTKWTSPEGMLKNLESKFFKVPEFVRALLGDPNATVGDMWMFRILFGDPKAAVNNVEENFTTGHAVAMRVKLQQLANQMSAETGEVWTPREVQAALWGYQYAKHLGKPFNQVVNYQFGLTKKFKTLGNKTPIEWLQDMVPNLNEGPAGKQLGVRHIKLPKNSRLEKAYLTQLSRADEAKTKPVKNIVEARRFTNALRRSPESTSFQNYTPTEIMEMVKGGSAQVFVTADGKAGVMVDNSTSQIMAAFSDSKIPGVGTNMFVKAIEVGGRKITLPEGSPLVDWLHDMFGFEVMDTVDGKTYMELTPQAVKLYTSPKTGKVTENLIRSNMEGFSGDFTQEVRFSREARKNLDQIADMSDEEIARRDADFVATGNSGMSVLTKVHEWRAQAQLNINRLVHALEQDFLERFGGKRTATSRTPLTTTGRLIHTAKTELLQKAMNLYIDSGQGENLQRVEAYANKLRKLEADRKITNKQREQLEIIDRMLAMTPDEQTWADTNIRKYYEEFFEFAQEKGLIDSHVENYVKRVWNMPKELKDAGITWSGTGTSGFQLKPTSGKQRTLNSIIDGWEAGMDLRYEGVLSNMQQYALEIGNTFSNRRFVDYMRGLIDFSSGSLMYEVNPKTDPDFKPAKTHKQVMVRGFAKPGHKLYARRDIANYLNALQDKADPTHWFWKLYDKINSMIKSAIFSVSFFHHLAGARSYAFGVQGAGGPLKRLRVDKAYKRGLDKLHGKEPFRNIGPLVDYLVREGLTLGRVQDWDEASLQDGWVENMLKNMTSNKITSRALKAKQEMSRFRRKMTVGLFGQLFAGLKAEAATVDFITKLTKLEKKQGSPATEAQMKKLASQVAALINADFGGLNYERLGRGQTAQRWMSRTQLAPDWTESNWRVILGGLIPGANKLMGAIRKRTHTELPPNVRPEMGKLYRSFLKGVALRGALSLMVLQSAILSLFGDDDDREEYYDFVTSEFVNHFARGKWANLDITPITRRLGIGDRDKRQTFNLLGHFLDIFKAVDFVQLVKHKISPGMRIGESLWSQTDWKGAPFKTVGDLFTGIVEEGDFSLTADRFSTERRNPYLTLPTILMYNFRQAFPIPASEISQALQGESSWLGSLARGAGMDIRDVRFIPSGEVLYNELNSEINELNRNLKNAQRTRDRELIDKAREDIRNYKDFNRVKSRVNYLKVQLRPINRNIEALEFKRDTKGLSDREERQLTKLKQRRTDLFKRFRKIMKR